MTLKIALWKFESPSWFQFLKWKFTWECGGSFPHTLLHSWEHEMWLPNSLLAHTFVSPCLGREPKVRVATIFISSKCCSSSNTICCTWSNMTKHGRSTMNFLLTARRCISTARLSAQTRCTCTSTPTRTPSASLSRYQSSTSSSSSYSITTTIKSLLASMRLTTRKRKTTTWTWSRSTRRRRRRLLWSTTQWSSSSSMRITKCTRSTSQIACASFWLSTTSGATCRSDRPLPWFITPRTALKCKSWAASTLITSASMFTL